MSNIECEAKQWGSSLGIIIPKNITERHNIHPGDKIFVEIQKTGTARKAFGKLSGWKKSSQELKDEAREGWEM